MTDAVDLFAGPGGWDLGARRLGLTTIGLDISEDAVATARAAGLPRERCNVAASDPARFDVDGLIASPPCQGFSTVGKGAGRLDAALLLSGIASLVDDEDVDGLIASLHARMSDDRSVLMLEPLRWTLSRRPSWLAFEQVPNALPIWQAFEPVLRRAGYAVDVGVLSAEAYGAPQVRRRAVLVASQLGDVRLPRPTRSRYHVRTPSRLDDGVERWLTMSDGLGWSDDVVPTFNDQSGTPYDARWPFLRPSTVVAGRGLVQNPGATANRFNGSTKSRNDGVRISVSEAGLLQTFPADYPWFGSLASRYQQAGDAVPPLLAEAILRAATLADAERICVECGGDLVADGLNVCLECAEALTEEGIPLP